jgi:hypothetical protein
VILTERQSAVDRALVREVMEGILPAWEPHHRKWMQKANHYYALYRNYQDLKNSYNSTATERGRDRVWTDGESEFGPEMFVPMAFSTVETVLPAMLSSNPEMTVLPRTPASEANVANVKAQLEAQQDQIDYPLTLQTIGKDGLITGLGVQKTWWRSDWRIRNQMTVDPYTGAAMPRQELQQLFDDPDGAAVDPFDFIVDPFAARIKEADGAFHRTWRSSRYVKRMADTRQWRNLDGASIEDIKSLAGSRFYAEVWRQRRSVGDRGYAGYGSSLGREDIHEVLEFHDGDRIVTILDRCLVVASGLNPSWHGELPFQCFRPTEVPHELHGIGEIEPIEQLQEELNILRTQRRYNADLVLQRVFAYHEGMVEKEDIRFGPGYAIGVNGDPREMLFPIQVGDIPNSGYQEEDRIGNDIDRTSGISDTIAGAGLEGGDTATGVQLVQSAASRRIEMKTRRMEKEIVGPGAKQFVELTQQHVLANRAVRIPALPQPDQPERRWAWFSLGPAEMAGQFEVRPVENSMQPENVPQNRADAQMAMTLLQNNPAVDQQKLVEFVVSKMGIESPQTFLAPPNPMIPAETLDRLKERGIPDQILAEALAAAGRSRPGLRQRRGPAGRRARAAPARSRPPGRTRRRNRPAEGGPPVKPNLRPRPSEGSNSREPVHRLERLPVVELHAQQPGRPSRSAPRSRPIARVQLDGSRSCRPSGAPKGAARRPKPTVAASGNAITFTGLDRRGQKYYATAEVAGAYRYVSFLAAGPPATPARRSKVRSSGGQGSRRKSPRCLRRAQGPADRRNTSRRRSPSAGAPTKASRARPPSPASSPTGP